MTRATSNGSGGRRFTHVRLDNWMNFPHVDVALESRVFVVGPNAAGKSNLLDAFRFLRDVVIEGGGFREAIRLRRGVAAIRSLAARRNPVVQIAVDVRDADVDWRYELGFRSDKSQRPVIESEIVCRDGAELFRRPTEDDRRDQERLSQTWLEQVNVNREFRELVAFLRSVRYLHVVPQLVREPDRSVGRSDDPFGGDFLEQIAKTREKTQEARLRRIRDALVVAVPQLREIELVRDERGTPHLRGNFEHWRPQGAWQYENQLSDGTLRLLGLLWSAMDGSGPLLLEEPELSLHPEIVRLLPPMFARIHRRHGRQILLSTHSPELLRDEGIGLDEVLLLCPLAEGTEVRRASDHGEIKALLDGGMSLGEAILPRTRPRDVQQMLLFEDL
jgi:predicted ATPase